MIGRRCTGVLLAVSLLANAFCLPADVLRFRRQVTDNKNDALTNEVASSQTPPVDDDFDDDFTDPVPASNGGGGGSNILSLLNLATAFLPGSSNSSNKIIRILQELILKSRNSTKRLHKRAIGDNKIEFDYVGGLKPPPFQRQENDGSSQESSSSESEEDNAAEESLEEVDNDNASQQNSDSNVDSGDDNDSDDYDEPPGGGDGQGGGILGILASLSGDEDGQSDLGSLLATVSGIVANLSGDGVDLNGLIASGLGLFMGLLSQEEENPGAVLASYLLTSVDTLTGGGAKNNGAFFGTFLSKLIKGTSAAGDPDASSEENDNNMMSDSAGFFASFLMSLLGDMSKGSSSSHPWRRHIK